jgi:hypothetical protein
MTDVNNISEVPFVVAEVHTVDTFCNKHHTTIIDCYVNTPNSTYHPHPERGANVQRMRLPDRIK